MFCIGPGGANFRDSKKLLLWAKDLVSGDIIPRRHRGVSVWHGCTPRHLLGSSCLLLARLTKRAEHDQCLLVLGQCLVAESVHAIIQLVAVFLVVTGQFDGLLAPAALAFRYRCHVVWFGLWSGAMTPVDALERNQTETIQSPNWARPRPREGSGCKADQKRYGEAAGASARGCLAALVQGGRAQLCRMRIKVGRRHHATVAMHLAVEAK